MGIEFSQSGKVKELNYTWVKHIKYHKTKEHRANNLKLVTTDKEVRVMFLEGFHHGF